MRHDKVPILIFIRERGFYYLQCSNSSWPEPKNNDKEQTDENNFYKTIQMGCLIMILLYTEFITSSK